MGAPTSITAWLHALPISWLTQNTNAYADATAQGTVYDGQVDLIKQAVEARFPDTTPATGLPYVGDNFGLIQGIAESDATFRIRCKDAWNQWALAGTFLEMLVQLFFTCGIGGTTTYIVQQNGLAYSLSGAPTAGQDPTSLLVITTLPLNYFVGDHSGVPWWYFDYHDDLCARFAIVMETADLPTPTASSKSILNIITNRWKPAKALYMGLNSLTTGLLWGYPLGTKWGDGGLTWGGTSTFLPP